MEVLFDVLLLLIFICALSVLLLVFYWDWKDMRQARQIQADFYRLANECLAVWLVKNREEVDS